MLATYTIFVHGAESDSRERLALDVAEGLDDLLGDRHGDATVVCVLLLCGVLT